MYFVAACRKSSVAHAVPFGELPGNFGFPCPYCLWVSALDSSTSSRYLDVLFRKWTRPPPQIFKFVNVIFLLHHLKQFFLKIVWRSMSPEAMTISSVLASNTYSCHLDVLFRKWTTPPLKISNFFKIVFTFFSNFFSKCFSKMFFKSSNSVSIFVSEFFSNFFSKCLKCLSNFVLEQLVISNWLYNY